MDDDDAPAGGAALSWPTQESEFMMFSFTVVETLVAKGYCLCETGVPDEVHQRAVQTAQRMDGWEVPPQQLGDAYLGREGHSRTQWLDVFSVEATPFNDFVDVFVGLNEMLAPIVGECLDFSPAPFSGAVMLRLPLAGAPGGSAQSQEQLAPGDLDEEVVAEHLDFVQRRRLCLMLVTGSGGVVELQPRRGVGWPSVRLPATRGQMLVFRHDLMSYTWTAGRANELLLQSWVMEAPLALRVDSYEGDYKAMEDVMEAVAVIPPERQVHIMSAITQYPASGHHLSGQWLCFAGCADGFTEVPLARWDMDLYYSSDIGAFGKTRTKHCAMVADEVLCAFDNKFFGMEEEVVELMPPLQRWLIENSFEAFALAGWTLDTLRGEPIAVSVGDIGSDWDNFKGLDKNPVAFLKASTIHSTQSAARMCNVLQLTGPVTQVDTACSSTCVAANIVHAYLRQRRIKEVSWGLTIGMQNILLPFPFIGLSGAGMLGALGRCVTFDQSANGYNRGEGIGGMTLKSSEEVNDVWGRLGCFVSGYVNQDGRSASLTAPNGPSQQACIRGSLRDARLLPADANAGENHGTGTALGDPIEVGSIRACFMKRTQPFPITSGKSNIGHLEAGAGSVGMTKVLSSILHSCVPPNVHLRQLNAHIEFDGFPAIWPTELTNLDIPDTFNGLNSFGFGGTNSRADLWAKRIVGFVDGSSVNKHKELKMDRVPMLDVVSVTCPRCLGPMDWLSAEATPDAPRKGKHVPSLIREEGALYDYCSNCYRGGYSYGELVGKNGHDPGRQVYMVGTWSAWSTFEEMEYVEDKGPTGGYYRGRICLGETLVEHFHLVLDRNPSWAIFPIVPKADQKKRVCGPRKNGQDRNWVINGHLDQAVAGALYEVRLTWASTHMSVTWKALEQQADNAPAGYAHSYSILSSLTGWKPLDMQQTVEDPHEWTFQGKLRHFSAEFLFMRDRDKRQLIYPLTASPSNSTVPVMGPDEGGYLKRFKVVGEAGDAVTVSLSIKGGDFSVVASSDSAGTQRWRSLQGPLRCAYHLCEASGGGSRTAMAAQAEADEPLVCVCYFIIREHGTARFHIVVNNNEAWQLHPETAGAAPGQTQVQGPDANSSDLYWELVGTPGQVVEVKLDLAAEDNRRMVTCRLVDAANW